MPYAIAVVEFPCRRNLQIAIYIVDNGYTRSTWLVLVSVLIDDRLKHLLRYDGLAIRSFYGVHKVLERVRDVTRIEGSRREFYHRAERCELNDGETIYLRSRYV
jgi:hypothetical protein